MALALLRDPAEVHERVLAWQRGNLSVGFVPTMGALHEGHLSLLRASASECDRTVLSVYVNPTQFGPTEDLSEYPRRLTSDAEAAARAGADLLFAPPDCAIYPSGFCTYVVQEGLTDVLCGAVRPGHFRGVLTVVLKLLNIVPADRAYFGRKDFQQSVVIARMVADLDLPVQVKVTPTVREPDGLAMSSRNQYLTPALRRQAVCLYEALESARRAFRAGEHSPVALASLMREVVGRRPDALVQYAEVVDPATLRSVETATDKSVVALAVLVGGVRLIDNMPLGESC